MRTEIKKIKERYAYFELEKSFLSKKPRFKISCDFALQTISLNFHVFFFSFGVGGFS